MQNNITVHKKTIRTFKRWLHFTYYLKTLSINIYYIILSYYLLSKSSVKKDC